MTLTDTRSLDLLSIIERETGYSFPERVQNYRDGDEFHGPCPFCKGGENRFHVYPNADLPHYWCRVCGAWGDALAFMQKYRGMFYGEACEYLDIEPGAQFTRKRDLALLPSDEPPSPGWQQMAENIVYSAEKWLWTKAPDALDYLRLTRGLSDETIKQFRIGYFPLMPDGKWFSKPFSDWGLDPDQLTEDQRAKGGVKVPNGFILPWYAADKKLWKLTVHRKFVAGPRELQYGQILGSKPCLFNADSLTPNTPALLAEAVFDAMSAHQCASDLLTCVSTDGARDALPPRWLARLALPHTLLLAHDADEAGDRGAASWQSIFPQSARRWQPWSHDLNDMLTTGKDIHLWASQGLKLTAQVVTTVIRDTPPALPVVDATMLLLEQVESALHPFFETDRIFLHYPDGNGGWTPLNAWETYCNLGEALYHDSESWQTWARDIITRCLSDWRSLAFAA